MKLKINRIFWVILFFAVLLSCKKHEAAIDILKTTIHSIDTIETVSYKQHTMRSNPQHPDDTVYTYREMYFKRLVSDSIVGVKGRWYFFNASKERINYEDIYDGDMLIRKNNRDSVALIYDLLKYPEFKFGHFWGHNTPFSLQYTLKQILKDPWFFYISMLNDTLIDKKACYQIHITTENKGSDLPGFKFKLIDKPGQGARIILNIDKSNFYPVRVRMENYHLDQANKVFFLDQVYFDLEFNIRKIDSGQFDTSVNKLKGFSLIEKTPQ